MRRRLFALLPLVLAGCSSAGFDGGAADVETNANALEGVPGGDEKVVPTVPVLTSCGTPRPNPFGAGSGQWGYEMVPSVVGPGEAFYIEVSTGPGTVASITLEYPPQNLGGYSELTFVDDGTGRDRVAGDGVFTSSPLWLTTMNAPLMLPGLGFNWVGMLRAHLSNGTSRDFAQEASVGFLLQGANRLPAVETATLAATNRVVEACTPGWQAQSALRFYDFTSIPALTGSLYGVVDDNVDFWTWFTTQHAERTYRPDVSNGVAGRHWAVWQQFTGGQQPVIDERSLYGSTKLRAVNFLDSGSRGTFVANVTHEIMHSWGAYLSTSLGLTDNEHYSARSNVGSLLGGFKWDLQSDGSYTRNCNEGKNGATRASDLELYLMGLLPASSVAPLRVAPATSPIAGCGEVVPTPHGIVTVQDIIAAHGAVTPGPGQAPTSYRVGFAVEVAGRRLTNNEREFYHRLSAAYTATPPAGPPPYIGQNWASIASFFPGSTWRSNLTTH